MLGREALRGRWGMAIVAYLIYYAAVYVPLVVLSFLFSSVPWIGSVYSVLVTGPLMLGCSIFALCLFRNDEPKAGQIFYGFEKFGKSLGLYLMISLLIFLRVLLIIPGVVVAIFVPFFAPFVLLLAVPAIIASINYSQAFFILADHHETGVLECISKSKALMAGNKLKYCLLGLSFIGWMILACIPPMVFGSMSLVSVMNATTVGGLEAYQHISASTGTSALMMASSGGFVVLLAYVMVVFAAFYEMASGNLRPGYITSTAEVI